MGGPLPRFTLDVFGQAERRLLRVEGPLYRPFPPTRLGGWRGHSALLFLSPVRSEARPQAIQFTVFNFSLDK